MVGTAVRTTASRIYLDGADLAGELTRPPDPCGVVLFAHGGGSPRDGPRGQQVADALNRLRLATLVLDLRTPDDQVRDTRARDLRSDVGLLADRLVGIVDRLATEPATGRLPVGLFGAGTGAAAALVTAASRPEAVRAVVARGGRPDLAGPALMQVAAPTLLLVGGRDGPVLELNQQARHAMTAPVELRTVPGATHLFDEPGALDVVTQHSGAWFTTYLQGV